MRKEFTLMKCIYCNCENDLTVSDIIPYAMTGAKVKKSFVCKTHNGFTNDNYEKKMISEFAFFRNRLGLTERDGDPVRYNAELNIGEYKFDNVSISDHTSILGSSKRRFKTVDKNGNKVLVANREALLKQKGFTADKIKDVSSTDVSIVARSNLQSLFVSSNTLHVIAKIAYEWHCYINDIESYDKDKYQEIVSYILDPDSDNNIVEIVLDSLIWDLMDHSSRTGSHMLFEYCDLEGNTYVVLGFWDVLIYRIKISSKFTECTKCIDGINAYNIYFYHVDGTKSGAIYLSENKLELLSEKCSAALDVLCNEIKIRLSKIGERDLTREYIKNQIENMKPLLQRYEDKNCTLAHLLDYEHEDRIIPVYIVEQLYLNQDSYDASKTFTQNMQRILMCEDKFIFTKEKQKEILLRYVKMDEENTFGAMLNSAINYFESL